MFLLDVTKGTFLQFDLPVLTAVLCLKSETLSATGTIAVIAKCVHVHMRLYIVTYHGWVVWLITRRGFGLDTGFIRYGDYNCSTDYNYSDHYTTGSFSDPTDGTALLWRLTSRTHSRTDSGDRLVFSVASHIQHLDGPIENLAAHCWLLGNQHSPTYCWLLCDQHWPSYCWLLCDHQYRSNERSHGNIQLRLPSNDGLQSNTSQSSVV
jgi:hypothetical protein